MNIEEFKDLFLKLIEYTIPHGKENTLEKYLPSGYSKDQFGNYYYIIGNSKTLFTTHLDTYSIKYEKVNYIIDDNNPYIIKSDGKNIIGGDNKLGVIILMNMIKDNIPGVYYFFAGEEPTAKGGGLYGSTNALKNNYNFFKNFDRCIAFDRKEYGSIVIRQMARMCCSIEFAKAISEELSRLGNIKWNEELNYGYYTDTAVFMDTIPECTNISAGGFKEHTENEWVDLNYTYNVYKTAIKINWESLPVVRQLETRYIKPTSKKIILTKYNQFILNKIKKFIDNIFIYIFDLEKTRDINTDDYTQLTYSEWLSNFDFDIFIKDNKIYLDDDFNDPYTKNDFLKYILEVFEKHIAYYIQNNEKNKLLKYFNKKDINEIIKKYKI